MTEEGRENVIMFLSPNDRDRGMLLWKEPFASKQALRMGSLDPGGSKETHEFSLEPPVQTGNSHVTPLHGARTASDGAMPGCDLASSVGGGGCGEKKSVCMSGSRCSL